MSRRARGRTDRRRTRPTPQRRRRWKLWTVLAVILTSLAVAVVFVRSPHTPSDTPLLNWEIPNPDTAPMQPRVAQLFGEARQAVVRRPDSAEAWGRFGAVYDAHGLYDGAIACYRKALALAPNDFRFIYNLGMVLEWSGDTSDEPLNLLQTAVRLEPDYPPVFVRLGDTLARAGRRREARDAYRRATELDPNFAIAHRSLGQVLLALDDVNTALAHLERAAQLMPNDGLVFAALAQSYLRLGQRQLADAAVEKSRRLPSNLALPDPIRYWVVSLGISSEICYERGKGLLRAGDYVGAIADLTIVEEVRPDNPHVQLYLGTAYLKTGQQELARAHLFKAVQLKDDLVQAHARLGSLLSAQGQLDEAIRHYRRALFYAPNDADLQASLARALARDGRLD